MIMLLNTLTENMSDLHLEDRFDVILPNPPFGASDQLLEAYRPMVFKEAYRAMFVKYKAGLEAFREELNQPTVKPAFEPRQISTDEIRQISPEQQQSLNNGSQSINCGNLAKHRKIARCVDCNTWFLLNQRENEQVAIADKLLLTMAQAQAMTGLSREFIKEAIASGELKAKLIGRAWRIKRNDLDQYVDKLF